ncbi:hypothetical protein EV1_034629 [Malus domestica]
MQLGLQCKLPGNSQSKDVRRRSSLEDLDHMWHPDSFRTHFTNGLLTLAINYLSLDKVWCHAKRIPPWVFLNANGLTHTQQFFEPEPGYELVGPPYD